MRRETILRVIFWVALAVALALALNPHPPQVPGSSDKVEHFLLFLGLTWLALAAYPTGRLALLALALSGFGALIEFLQMVPALNRSAELLDWVADMAGIIVAIATAALIRRGGAR